MCIKKRIEKFERLKQTCIVIASYILSNVVLSHNSVRNHEKNMCVVTVRFNCTARKMVLYKFVIHFFPLCLSREY